jgi:hypothetical protein
MIFAVSVIGQKKLNVFHSLTFPLNSHRIDNKEMIFDTTAGDNCQASAGITPSNAPILFKISCLREALIP